MAEHDLPEVPTREDVEEFYEDLSSREKASLNALPTAEYPRWARKVINDERQRRKNLGSATSAPSEEEKEEMIARGLGGNYPSQQ
ncbi:hypothetical protein BGZ65_006398, partial [Modicella reniformis]